MNDGRTVWVCYSCGHEYQDEGFCPKCGRSWAGESAADPQDARVAFLEKALEEFEKGFNAVYPGSEFHLKHGHGEPTARNFFGRSKPNAAQWLKEREDNKA